MGLRVKLVDQIVGAEAHLALLAVQQRIGEGAHVAAGLPDAGIHQNVGVHLEGVVPLLDEALAPGVLDVVLQTGAEGAVVPGVGQAAVDLGAGKDKAPVFAEGHDFVHGFFGVIHSFGFPPC